MSDYHIGATLRVKGNESGVTYNIQRIYANGQRFVLVGPGGVSFRISLVAIEALMVPA